MVSNTSLECQPLVHLHSSCFSNLRLPDLRPLNADLQLRALACDDRQVTHVIPQVTIAVLTAFVTELTMRQIAKGRRFWRDWWCIFDFVVRIS